MSSTKLNQTSTPEQLSLLDITEGRLEDVGHSVRGTLVKMIRGCPLSRYQIAARISELMCRDVSKEMLDKYCSETAEGHRFPAELIPAICQVTGSLALLRIFAEPLHCSFLDSKESRELEIVKLKIEKEKLRKRIKALERGEK